MKVFLWPLWNKAVRIQFATDMGICLYSMLHFIKPSFQIWVIYKDIFLGRKEWAGMYFNSIYVSLCWSAHQSVRCEASCWSDRKFCLWKFCFPMIQLLFWRRWDVFQHGGNQVEIRNLEFFQNPATSQLCHLDYITLK